MRNRTCLTSFVCDLLEVSGLTAVPCTAGFEDGDGRVELTAEKCCHVKTQTEKAE